MLERPPWWGASVWRKPSYGYNILTRFTRLFHSGNGNDCRQRGIEPAGKQKAHLALTEDLSFITHPVSPPVYLPGRRTFVIKLLISSRITAKAGGN